MSIGGILAVALILAAAVAVTRWPPLRWLVYAAWMMPFVELSLLAAGQMNYRWRFRTAPAGTYRHAIIQVTSKGAEHQRVSEIIAQIRSYKLPFSHQIWVVIEPGYRQDYPLADRVLVVPAAFAPQSRKKARALEYSRRVRQQLGYARGNVKVIFNDDDVTLTRGYLLMAFTGDYDVCQGVVSPRTSYATRPLGHFLASHADDIRTHACLVYCSVFQGILHRPLHVHGEGLATTGLAEQKVTWDWPATASEDLVFGHKARKAGLRWGWFHEYAEVTSPWTLRDFITQRERWLWGDIEAVSRRELLPPGSSVMVATKYAAGVAAIICSVTGLYLRLSGAIPATAPVLMYAKLSVVAWVTVVFACGWLGASSRTDGRDNDSRLLAGVLAVVMMPVSALITLAAIIIPLMRGNPRTFKTIAKTRSAT